jgi:hypothetical protein
LSSTYFRMKGLRVFSCKMKEWGNYVLTFK